MEIVKRWGDETLAMVYLMKTDRGYIEAVESVQPPYSREEKWVIIVSTLYGCPVNCMMCDAGGGYKGRLTTEEILEQIRLVVTTRYQDGEVPSKKFKIQFARMGEPAFNPSVLDVLNRLHHLYKTDGLIPSVSTIAPAGADTFMNELLEIKNRYYKNGRFQLQFSIHTTDRVFRDKLIPTRKWDYDKIAEFGNRWFSDGDRKITLNFSAIRGWPIDPGILKNYFDPDKFIIKLTPLNPTHRVKHSGLKSWIDPNEPVSYSGLIESLRSSGFDVILSIGELNENLIGSNCGQYVTMVEQGKLTQRQYKDYMPYAVSC